MNFAHVAFLAVDPGRRTGWAFFDSFGRLVSCGLTTGDAPVFAYEDVRSPLALLVIEDAHQGRGEASEGDLEVLERRRQRAIVAARACHTVKIVPNRWKGSVPKMVRTPAGVSYPGLDRIRAKFRGPEAETFARYTKKVGKTVAHNVLEAAGIGMYWAELRGYPFRVGA